MRRKVSALLGVALAMLLSVAVAIPANADMTGGKPMPPDPRFKYGLDYYYKEIFDPSKVNGVDKPPGYKPLPVSGSVNPSKTGGSWYLNNQQKTRTLAPGNKPLTGKVFLPGEPLPNGKPGGTVVKPPSVYKPTAPFAGSMGLGRLLGTAGVGMGGITQTPSNVNEMATAAGVGAGCIADRASCTRDEMGKIFTASNCGHTASCKTQGAKDEYGNPIVSDLDWWKDTAVPFLADLFAKITGQTDDGATTPSDAHIPVTVRGCTKEVEFTYRGENNGTISVKLDSLSPRPSTTIGKTYWDADCAAPNLTAIAGLPGRFETRCLDKATGMISTSGSNVQTGAMPTWFNADGTNKASMCGSGTPATHTLLHVRFWNENTQAYYDSSQPSYDAIIYSEWINPDPNIDHIEDLTATTTVDCKGANGEVFTYSEVVKKTGAFSAPACPEGFDLARHDVKVNNGTGTKTLDSGSADAAAAAQYPLCNTATGPGCSLWVKVDGAACTSGRTECHTWADIATRQPSRIGCMWGTYTMPVSDCYSIAEGYKAETGLVLDPKSGAWVSIDTLGNPIAPSPQPWNPTNPTPVAGATPGTPPAPTGSFPGSGTNPSDGCVNPVWSWNPVDWVKSPALCAMREGFEPKTDVQARATALANLAADTVPIAWIATPMVGPSGGGCPAWNINVAGLSENVVCDSSFTAAIVGARGGMFGIVASAMIWPLIRGIWYALIPIVRVSPGGSK